MSTVFSAYIQSGTADPNCPPELVPQEVRKAAEFWNAQGEEAYEEILALLSRCLKANFVPENISRLDELIVETEDVEAYEVVATDFHFHGGVLPSVSAYANYRLTTVGPVDEERLEEWQDEESEYLTDCVNFFWAFEDPSEEWSNVLGDHEGAGFEVSE